MIGIENDEGRSISTLRHVGLKSLPEILKYKNSEVIVRFCEKWDVENSVAESLFTETLKWLWLSAASADLGRANKLMMYRELQAIDEMWHMFILFSEDYRNFCKSYLGQFIDHAPASTERAGQSTSSVASNLIERREQLKSFYSLVYDLLGEETLRLWGAGLPELGSKCCSRHTLTLAELFDRSSQSSNTTQIDTVVESGNQSILGSEILDNLKSHGYVIIKNRTEADFKSIAKFLGQIIDEQDVSLDSASRSLLNTSQAMPLHTDHSYARYVTWHCLKQATSGGESIVFDSSKILSFFSNEELIQLAKIRIEVPAMKDIPSQEIGLITGAGEGLRIYYAPWLVRRIPQESQAAYQKLNAFFNRAQEDLVNRKLLRAGDILIVDNWRALHGRSEFEPGSERILRRLWVR